MFVSETVKFGNIEMLAARNKDLIKVFTETNEKLLFEMLKSGEAVYFICETLKACRVIVSQMEESKSWDGARNRTFKLVPQKPNLEFL